MNEDHFIFVLWDASKTKSNILNQRGQGISDT